MTLSLEEIEKLEKLCASKKGDWYLLEAPWLGDELTAILEGSPDPHGGKFLFNAEAATDCVSDEESDANIAYSWAVSRLVVQGINALPELLSMAKRSIELEWIVEKVKTEAVIWKGESRTANSTINEINQLVSGATGEKANWNGAEPVRVRLATLQAENEKLREELNLIKGGG